MSSTQLQELLAQVEQLTIANNKLQQELSNNSNHIARLESAMLQRRLNQDDAPQSWSRSSSVNSNRSAEDKLTSSNTAQNSQSSHKARSMSGSVHNVLPSSQSSSSSHTAHMRREPSADSDILNQEKRERRDSGSCDHTEVESNGIVFRDVMTNTPSASNIHFRQLASLEALNSPAVVSSDKHGNEFITIGTQTSEVMPYVTYNESENIRGCAKAATPQQLSAYYHGAWPFTDNDVGTGTNSGGHETQSVVSFHSSISSHSSMPSNHNREYHKSSNHSSLAHQVIAESQPFTIEPQILMENPPLGSKVQMVYSLLSMLGTHDPEDMSQTLLAMSSSPDSCAALRQSGCLPLLVQLIYGSEKEEMAAGRVCRARACKALHNIIHSTADEKRNRRELKILKYLEIVQSHIERIREDEVDDHMAAAESIWPPDDHDRNPGPAVAALMKLSFDDHSRQPICSLGGLQCMAQLIKFDQSSYGASSDIDRITMRRYACMTLTNLTFGDSTNKARLCAMQGCLNAIVHQLQSFNEDLCQVAASVIRNLSWKADQASKRYLRLSHATTKLMTTALQVSRESTLKSILSALWNLSAHCTQNKKSICDVEGSIIFLVKMLGYQAASKTLAIVECAGGILRNISSVIAVREDYRQTLREHNALQILLSHLRSPSLAVVGNACGALWNISARCSVDQQTLVDLGAISLLKNLISSKHRLISMGSSATIKNLTAYKNEAPTTSNKTGSMTKSRQPAAGLKKGLHPDLPSPSKQKESILEEASDSENKVQRSGSQESIGSCSSLSNNEGQITLKKIDQILQQVLQTTMEMHQLRKSTSTAQSSDTRINSGSSTPRAKQPSTVNAVYPSMSRSSEYLHGNLTGSMTVRQHMIGNATLSPRVTNKRNHVAGAPYIGLDRYRHMSDDSVEETNSATNFSMTYNDDNIDNSSEKPVDYSRRYQEINSFDMSNSNPDELAEKDPVMMPLGSASRHLAYSDSQLPTFLHRDASLLLQPNPSTGFNTFNPTSSYMDPMLFIDFNVPTLDQLKSRALAEITTPSIRVQSLSVHSNLSSIPTLEDQHGEDQVTTFYTEGTPLNFLSTATSLNELNRIGLADDLGSPSLRENKSGIGIKSKLPHGSLEPQYVSKQVMEKAGFTECSQSITNGASKNLSSSTAQKFMESTDDERPKTYATEGTPLNGVSRVCSQSDLLSVNTKPTGLESQSTAEDFSLQAMAPSLEKIQENEVLSPKVPAVTKNSNTKNVKTGEHKSVSFDDHAHIQETPMMFSRASSLASLESFDQHSLHSSVVSDYSRRASQVVSPSELPDSPGSTTPNSPQAKNTGAINKSETAHSTQKQEKDLVSTNQATDSNLQAMSMFGSLSGLVSLQGPEIINKQNQSYPSFIQPDYHMLNMPNHNSLNRPIPSYNNYHKNDPAVLYGQLHASQTMPGQLNSLQYTSTHMITQQDGNKTAQQKSNLDSLKNIRSVMPNSASYPSFMTPTAPHRPAIPRFQSNHIQDVPSMVKVDQFLTDTIRTFATEGTPGPGSTRSSLSALTFLDEPESHCPPPNPLKLSFSASKESLSSNANRSGADNPKAVQEVKEKAANQSSQDSPSKPLDLTLKRSAMAESTPVLGETDNNNKLDVAPPLPPKPSHLAKSSKPAIEPQNSVKSPSINLQGEEDKVALGNSHSRSRTTSDSVHESDSSLSDGDDIMLQKCISSAMPISRKKLIKSSSEETPGVAARSGRVVPRSKTFGSKLRMPSKKVIRAAQLAKRQTPPIVSANSPTPDDDYFAEDTVRSYCTEDTPYNKSTATSLSDLSVIDDDANLSSKSDVDSKTGASCGDSSPNSANKANEETKESLSDSSCMSDDGDDEDGCEMLSNAIFSALPKKAIVKQIQPLSSDHMLKITSNEIRATDVKYQTSGDSMRNYATEGTPYNYSASTSLSDLTLDSHYSNNQKTPASSSKQVADKPANQQPISRNMAAIRPITNNSAKQYSLLPKRQAVGQGRHSNEFFSSPSIAESSPVVKTLQGKLIDSSNSYEGQDEMKTFVVEGTPFNYSRRESLSSLSCDDDADFDDEEHDVTVIHKFSDKSLAEPRFPAQGIIQPAGKTSQQAAVNIKPAGIPERNLMAPPTVSVPMVKMQNGIIQSICLPPPSDGLKSRDEVRRFTPIEGTPYSYSRNSPLSSLDGSDSDDELSQCSPERPAASASALSSINDAHKAEGGKSSSSDSSDSDSESGESLAFLDHCISSAMPKKQVMASPAVTKPSAIPISTTASTANKKQQVVKPMISQPVKTEAPSESSSISRPPSVNLLPASGEMVVSQRSLTLSGAASRENLPNESNLSTSKPGQRNAQI